MKKFLNVLFVTLTLNSIDTQANTPLLVQEELSVKYWATNILHYHANAMESAINAIVNQQDCLAGKLSIKITKERIARFFRDDTPGEVTLTYKTKCFKSELSRVQFSVDNFGYDEDYTNVILRFLDKDNKTLEQVEFCIYGLDAEIRTRCFGKPDQPKFSRSVL